MSASLLNDSRLLEHVSWPLSAQFQVGFFGLLHPGYYILQSLSFLYGSFWPCSAFFMWEPHKSKYVSKIKPGKLFQGAVLSKWLWFSSLCWELPLVVVTGPVVRVGLRLRGFPQHRTVSIHTRSRTMGPPSCRLCCSSFKVWIPWRFC